MMGKMYVVGLAAILSVLITHGESASLNPCEFVCPLSLIPVCGSNGDTYESECDLRKANCKQRSLINITVAHEGPCESTDCEFVCPLSLMPVCGSDGDTYDSECDLKRVSCLRRGGVKLTKVHDGECGSTDCEFVCLLSLVPVCGSDGETYDSECDLKRVSCLRRGGLKLTKAYDGKCVDPANCDFPCQLSLSPVCGSDGDTYDSECDLKRVSCLRRGGLKLTKVYDGKCVEPGNCDFPCQLSLSPVCGSDGDTYDSECDLKRVSCLRRGGLKLTKVYDGKCVEPGNCDLPCQLSLSPVCGSDGDTYDSECDLKRVSCLRRSGIKLTKAYDGPCKKASVTKSKPCKFACPLSLLPVCGTDGQTYPSECDLRKAACKRRILSSLNVAYKGPCADAKPCDFVCRFSMVPVCGSDGHTYLNECDLKQMACKRRGDHKLRVQHTGPCECDLVFCRYSQSQVCGSDGKTYDNECDLKQSACRRGADVSVKSAGACK